MAKLGGQEITYTLTRSRRRSIGLQISQHGLRISAPLHTPLSHIDSVLQQKAGWITKKLAQWQDKKSLALDWSLDATYPLLGEPWHMALQPAGELAMIRSFDEELPQLHAIGLTSRQIQTFVMGWYQQQAITCFKQRIELYAPELAIPIPPFRLSQAKTRWGSCNSRGVISLNWRLIQLPLHLVDYVVAHELAHLIEMNHSKTFWNLVEDIYPNYQVARNKLKGYG
ncbi:MAG: M48 family metallopeptidase [Proteobacteria bacterium]|nr:M48 family metallopeptidase [Pseudomonadota bacterium]